MTYSDGTYTTTVAATQTKANWATASDNDSMKIGGQSVAAKTLKGWTITGNVENGTVTITEKAQ